MPLFQYTAMDSAGKEKKGKMDAPSEDAVASALKEQGMFPTSIKATSGKKSTSKKSTGLSGRTGGKKKGFNMDLNLGPVVIKTKDLTIITRQLAILLDAGLPLIRSLRTLEKQSKNPAIRKTLNEAASSVEGGATFSEALSQHPKSFNKLYLNMIKAGEAAGAMESILNRLAEFMEKAARITAKVKSAMVYPAVVLTIAMAITTGLMVFIVPKFQKIFTELLEGGELPKITQFVEGISNAMQRGAGLLADTEISWAEGPLEGITVIVLAIITYKIVVKFDKGRYMVDWLKFKAPLFGPIISKSAISRFARTLGTLMSSGVPVLQALTIVKETAGNEVVTSAVQKVHDAVKEGEGIAGPLAATKIFPQMVISMMEVGEETGKLPEMLDKISDTYDEEVDNAVGALTSLIEPIMIIFLALIVGTIVIALFMPLISLVDKFGG